MGVGIRQRGPQRLRPDDVELDMAAVHAEVTADELGQAADPLLALQERWGELHVEKRAAGLDLIHLAGGPQHCGGAAAIGPLHPRDPFGKRLLAAAPTSM